MGLLETLALALALLGLTCFLTGRRLEGERRALERVTWEVRRWPETGRELH